MPMFSKAVERTKSDCEIAVNLGVF